MILSVIIIISNLYGLYTRNLVVNLVVTVLLLLTGKCVFPHKVDGIALLWKKLFNAGAYLLLLGLCFEPFQDGIKKIQLLLVISLSLPDWLFWLFYF